MTIDRFETTGDSLIAPARHAFSIVPNDSADLGAVTKAIYIGTGGSVKLRAIGSDSDVTFLNVQSGAILDVRCKAIRASGTSAQNIVGLA